MDLPTGWLEGLGYSPLLIALLALVGASLVILFLAPAFFNLLKKTKFPARFSFIKRHPKRSLAFIIVILVAIFGAYVYYSFSQPVRIVFAGQLRIERLNALKQVQSDDATVSDNSGIYLLDIRSRKEYAVEHLKQSDNKPADRNAAGMAPLDGVDLVIYSTGSRFTEARRVADVIKKHEALLKGKYTKKPGKVYIVRDGFEGLKKAGLATESGGFD